MTSTLVSCRLGAVLNSKMTAVGWRLQRSKALGRKTFRLCRECVLGVCRRKESDVVGTSSVLRWNPQRAFRSAFERCISRSSAAANRYHALHRPWPIPFSWRDSDIRYLHARQPNVKCQTISILPVYCYNFRKRHAWRPLLQLIRRPRSHWKLI